MAPVNQVATQNTAQVMHDVGADVLAVVEADNRPALIKFEQIDLLRIERGKNVAIDVALGLCRDLVLNAVLSESFAREFTTPAVPDDATHTVHPCEGRKLADGFIGFNALGLVTWGSTNSFTLTSIPMFILMAEILLQSGVLTVNEVRRMRGLPDLSSEG